LHTFEVLERKEERKKEERRKVKKGKKDGRFEKEVAAERLAWNPPTSSSQKIRMERDMIHYTHSSAGVQPEQLAGFFEGWSNPPSAETHLRILRASSHVVLAVDSDDRVVGFVTAISDGVLSAYVPLLEVLPFRRRRGIASELIRQLLRELDGLYSINLHCDPELQPFYERLGMRALCGMAIRNYSAQAGRHTG
jgi:ribosomal protein S18 acetylase RimI-like enzyme